MGIPAQRYKDHLSSPTGKSFGGKTASQSELQVTDFMAISQRIVQYIAWLGDLGNVEQGIWFQLCRWLTSILALTLVYELGPFQMSGFSLLDENSNQCICFLGAFWGIALEGLCEGLSQSAWHDPLIMSAVISRSELLLLQDLSLVSESSGSPGVAPHKALMFSKVIRPRSFFIFLEKKKGCLLKD